MQTYMPGPAELMAAYARQQDRLVLAERMRLIDAAATPRTCDARVIMGRVRVWTGTRVLATVPPMTPASPARIGGER